ncbi:MAG: aminoacyl-tRNA hydrolase [Gammaproteobacteria bacterium]|nr:aminoacyl-tRNA hydrolase [Gammaproteobacteria bacterium]
MTTGIRLIVGLGNPGAAYDRTRHNAGADLVQALARGFGVTLRHEARFHGSVARVPPELRLLVPGTFMNRSGQAVLALLQFYQIAPENMLVVHDDLDLPPGTVRLKLGGGHGGHNGLRDIMSALGERRDFARLRIGIGHPGPGADVVSYVLRKPPPAERELIDSTFARAADVIPDLMGGDFDRAMRRLHTIN